MTDKKAVTNEQRSRFSKVIDEADSDKLLELFEVGGTSDEAKAAYEAHRTMMVEKYHASFMEVFGLDKTKEEFADALDSTAHHHAELNMMHKFQAIMKALASLPADAEITDIQVIPADKIDNMASFVPGPATKQ
jgi:hypothetical protein